MYVIYLKRWHTPPLKSICLAEDLIWEICIRDFLFAFLLTNLPHNGTSIMFCFFYIVLAKIPWQLYFPLLTKSFLIIQITIYIESVVEPGIAKVLVYYPSAAITDRVYIPEKKCAIAIIFIFTLLHCFNFHKKYYHKTQDVGWRK